jgi:hypothetical protein
MREKTPLGGAAYVQENAHYSRRGRTSMREEIRLGNDALAQNDMETAKRHFQQLLDNGGTRLQEQIAANRLREIRIKQEALRTPPPSNPPVRRKAPRSKKPDHPGT